MKKSFTLIESAVVIGLIALLLGILFSYNYFSKQINSLNLETISLVHAIRTAGNLSISRPVNFVSQNQQIICGAGIHLDKKNEKFRYLLFEILSQNCQNIQSSDYIYQTTNPQITVQPVNKLGQPVEEILAQYVLEDFQLTATFTKITEENNEETIPVNFNNNESLDIFFVAPYLDIVVNGEEKFIKGEILIRSKIYPSLEKVIKFNNAGQIYVE